MPCAALDNGSFRVRGHPFGEPEDDSEDTWRCWNVQVTTRQNEQIRGRVTVRRWISEKGETNFKLSLINSFDEVIFPLVSLYTSSLLL